MHGLRNDRRDPRDRLDHRLAAAGLRASGLIGAVGVGCLAAMFVAFGLGARSAGMAFGWVNDVTGVVTLPLALPGVLALHARVRRGAGPASDALLLVGVGAGGSIVVLQVLLLTGTLPFEAQVGPVSIAYLVLAAWYVAWGRQAARAGVVRDGTRLGVLAAVFVGYPVWALRLASALDQASASSRASTRPRFARG